MNVLVLNAGSSTLKFRLFADETMLASGLVEKWGTPQASLRLTLDGQPTERRSVAAETPAQAAEHAIAACKLLGIDAIGHRVVHGGWRFIEPTKITPEVIQDIRDVSSLAPLHNGLALEGIEAGLRMLPDTPAVAVFDTAFHRTIPRFAALYALPLELSEGHHLKRYGFHGISHQYVSGRLLESMGRHAIGSRLISCHLGNGSSLCAIGDGKSVDTSMGLTPMEGLVMGTRTGDIDPGLVLYLMTALKMTAQQVNDLLNRKSGLLGLSGRSGDMRDVERAAGDGDARAQLALEAFAYRIRKYIGAYAAALGGLDAIAFTAGIGEHSVGTRRRVCSQLEFLGLSLDQRRNESVDSSRPVLISQDHSAVQIWVIPTHEERQIAREVRALLPPPPVLRGRAEEGAQSNEGR